MAEEKKYYIKVPEALVEVTEEVYLAYFQTRRRWSAQEERDTYNGVISYDAMDTEDILGEEAIPDPNASGVEDMVVDKLLREKLQLCLPKLTKMEQSLIQALFYERKTEREYAKTLGISQKAVNKRRHKVLAKLRFLMES